MAQLRISPRASEDLLDIWSYIADDSEANADGFIDKIYETMELLARQPGLFLAPFSWGTQKRVASASKASGCFIGGNPMG